MLDDGSVQVDCGVDSISGVESNDVRMETPAMASFGQTSFLGSGESVETKVQICQASSQDSAQTDPSLKAHDYIGLCEVSSRALRAEASCVDGEQQNVVVNFQETELRLGPPKALSSLKIEVPVPFIPKQGPVADAKETADGQSSLIGRAAYEALLQKSVRPSQDPKGDASAEYIKEVGGGGVQNVLIKNESFKRRCVEESMEGWDLGIGLPAQVAAYPKEEVGENKPSCMGEKLLKKPTLDSKEQLAGLRASASAEPFEDDRKPLSKNSLHQQQDMEGARPKPPQPISAKGHAEYASFGQKRSQHMPQERGSSHLQELGATHKFWQAHAMARDTDGSLFPKSFDFQSHQDLETSSANLKRAVEGMNGARILPTTPKYGMAGAKRGFSEAIGKGKAIMNGAANRTSSEGMGVADSESKLFKPQLPPPMFPWGSSKRPLASWTSGVSLPDGAAPCEPFPSPGKTLFNGDPGILPLKQGIEAFQKKFLGQGSAPELVPGAKDARIALEEDTTASAQRAPVGWPPVQSFRKNSLPPPKPKTVVTPPTLPPVLPRATQSECVLVKVYMDGLPFGRKVDLRTVSNYEELSLALEQMFTGFMKGQSGNKVQGDPKYLCNSEYVIAYEDKDGDLMLVGDVPWRMFVMTVKRLRIMKGSGAVGLSLAASDPVKC